MNENIHRETFREILNLPRSQRSRVWQTAFPLTFKSYWKVFDYSFMWEQSLPHDAQCRQDYVEQIARKHNCKVKRRAVYSTTGKIDDLLKVRNEVIDRMYVSPVLWTPMSVFGDRGGFSHLKTFVFGFFPYCDKQPFVYDSNVKTNAPVTTKIITDDNLNTDALHQIVSKRIKLLNDGITPDKIRLEKDVDSNGELFYAMIRDSGSNTPENADDNIYPTDMSPEEYFQVVVRDCAAECFVVPEYKMLFAKTTTPVGYTEKTTDYVNGHKIQRVWRLLNKRLATTTLTELIFDGCYCCYFGYDDTRFDSISQHLGFFDVPDNLDY